MKNLAFAVLLVLAPGCMTGYIDAANTYDAEMIVLERHDAYVSADTTLDPAKKASELRTSALLRAAYNEANKANEKDAVPSHDSTPTQDPPCDWAPGEPCGCTPEFGECKQPCVGCCPTHGCWATKPNPSTSR